VHAGWYAGVSRKTTSLQTAHRPATRPPNLRQSAKSFEWIGVSVLLLIAAAFRLLWLGEPAFRADTIHFWILALQGQSFGRVWSTWMQTMGDTAQFPLPAALAVVPTSAFGLAVSAFAVRLPDALMGILTVLAAWAAGRQLAGPTFGLAYGLFIAANPLHIQMSREAYFYSTLVLGSFLVLICVILTFRFPARPRSWAWLGVWATALFLTAYSHFTGWILAGVSLIAIVLRLYACKTKEARRSARFALLGGVLVGLPLLVFPWAIPYLLKRLGDASAKAESIRVMGELKTPLAEMLAGYVSKMMWGNSWWALALVILCAIGFAGILLVGARRTLIRYLAALFAVCTVGYLVVMKSQGMYEAVRHVSFLFPLTTLLLFYGLWAAPRLKWVRGFMPHPWRSRLALVVIGTAIAMQAPAAWAAVRLKGSPTPYKEISSWCDANLPRGTLVLIDRWFEPWNEMAVHPASNVVYTFTVPNEPPDVLIKNRWRDSVVAFFEKFPDAAYIPLNNSYQHEPLVGPWRWPDEYFAHKTLITNEAGIFLRDRGVAYREDFYTASNRVVVPIYYNTREAILSKARAEGRPWVLFYAPDWQYAKPWRQTGDFRDWKVMTDVAHLEIASLTNAPFHVRLSIRGMAANGQKIVRVPTTDQAGLFRPGHLATFTIGPVKLEPGVNRIELRDPQRSIPQTLLLVDNILIERVDD
jgi:hypothetical protein